MTGCFSLNLGINSTQRRNTAQLDLAMALHDLVSGELIGHKSLNINNYFKNMSQYLLINFDIYLQSFIDKTSAQQCFYTDTYFDKFYDISSNLVVYNTV